MVRQRNAKRACLCVCVCVCVCVFFFSMLRRKCVCVCVSFSPCSDEHVQKMIALGLADHPACGQGPLSKVCFTPGVKMHPMYPILYAAEAAKENKLLGSNEGRMLTHSPHPWFHTVQIFCINWHPQEASVVPWGIASKATKSVFIVQTEPPRVIGHFGLLYQYSSRDNKIKIYHDRVDMEYALSVAEAIGKRVPPPVPQEDDEWCAVMPVWPGSNKKRRLETSASTQPAAKKQHVLSALAISATAAAAAVTPSATAAAAVKSTQSAAAAMQQQRQSPASSCRSVQSHTLQSRSADFSAPSSVTHDSSEHTVDLQELHSMLQPCSKNGEVVCLRDSPHAIHVFFGCIGCNRTLAHNEDAFFTHMKRHSATAGSVATTRSRRFKITSDPEEEHEAIKLGVKGCKIEEY